MKALTIVVMLAVGIVGCGKKSSANQSLSPELSFLASSSCKIAQGQDPFSCLEKKCIANHGTYDRESHHCDCGSRKVFVGWGEGICTSYAIANKCLKESNGYSKHSEDKDFTDCSKIAAIKDSAVFIKDLREKSGNSKLAEWADKEIPQALDEINSLPLLFQDLSISYLIGPGFLDNYSSRSLSFLKRSPPLTLHQSRESGTNMLDQVHYILDTDNLKASLTEGFFDGKARLPAPGSNDSQLILIQQSLNHILAAPFIPDSSTMYTDDGCAGYCKLRQSFQLQNILALRIRSYTGGRRFEEKIIFHFDHDSGRVGVSAHMLPSGQVSLIYVVHSREEYNNIVDSEQIYDRFLNPLFKTRDKHNAHENISNLIDGLNKLPDIVQIEPTAVVCELQFDNKEILFSGRLFRGPLGDTAIGWSTLDPVDTNSKNPHLTSSFWTSIFYMSDIGSSASGLMYSNHALDVGLNISGKDKTVKLIPISGDYCLSYGERWVPQVRKYPWVKVVNMSVMLPFTPSACAQSSIGKQLRENKNNFLYVVAAGNDAIDVTTEGVGSMNDCPQALSGMDNLIVVSSGTANSIHVNSNFGTHFGDLVASGKRSREGGQSYATSFAAPNVTHVAAKIAYRFPNISISQLRKALLFGADIPKRNGKLSPLPVRSGGYLNEAMAIAIAGKYEKQPDITDSEVIALTYCHKGDDLCSKSTDRISIYKERGLIK